MGKKPTKRWAIYTRKSSEEGLQQEYNSLNAQRDSAKAFIASQKHEGWRALKKHYDDGGISGGHLRRPALQALIADIKEGLVDGVAVYKVDRLSRSLADFAELMRLFEKHAVALVSVTQQLNTQSSMGRLTLNMLLSFAQFERELTGERIRDKIALSKQKGKWMGGFPPLGYTSVKAKLRIHPEEARAAQACFAAYLGSSGLIEAACKLNAEGFKTKAYTSAQGKHYGGQVWRAESLRFILRHPLYIGKVQHKGKVYDGEHAAIIEEELWQEVQDKLTASQVPKSQQLKALRLTHPLAGYLRTEDGHALSPTHTSKLQRYKDGRSSRKSYRYYVSQKVLQEGRANSSIRWVSAGALERATVCLLAQALRAVASKHNNKHTLPKNLRAHAEDLLQARSLLELGNTIKQLSPSIIVGCKCLRVSLKLANITQVPAFVRTSTESSTLLNASGLSAEVSFAKESISLEAEVSFARRRGKSQIIDSKTGRSLRLTQTNPNPQLIQRLAEAHYWNQCILDNPTTPLHQLLKPCKLKPCYIRRLCKLAYLSPKIKHSIFQGTQAPELRIEELLKPLPLDWEEQERVLGFGKA